MEETKTLMDWTDVIVRNGLLGWIIIWWTTTGSKRLFDSMAGITTAIQANTAELREVKKSQLEQRETLSRLVARLDRS